MITRLNKKWRLMTKQETVGDIASLVDVFSNNNNRHNSNSNG